MIIEAIIEFLFSNIVFVFVAIGGIISFLKRLRESEQKNSASPQKKSPQMPKTIYETANKKELINTIETKEETTSIAELMNQKLEESFAQKQKQFKDEKRSVSFPKRKTFTKSASKKSLTLKQQVIEGIIWSEILSEPRSKRPYMLKQHRHKKG